MRSIVINRKKRYFTMSYYRTHQKMEQVPGSIILLYSYKCIRLSSLFVTFIVVFINEGLFTADQNVRRGSARFTRQNRNGNRRGYECPEERDYYPYWHPTEWKDIAVLAENASRCSFYQSESFNIRPRREFY